MKIYLDIFFLVNAGMNFVILLAESFFDQRNVRILRLVLSSVWGAAVACLMLVFRFRRVMPLFVFCYLIVSIVLIRLAFGKTTPGTMIRNLVLYYVVAFLLAGLLLQLQKVFHLPLTGITLLIVMVVVLLVLRWILPKLRKRQERSGSYYRIRLYYEGRHVEGNALLDTGNGLYDPISRRPVMLGDTSFLQRLWKRGGKPVMRIIPFHSIGKESGLLHAFQAELLEVEKEGHWERISKPWVAVCDKYVSVDGEYEVILHPDMLIKERKKEEQ